MSPNANGLIYTAALTLANVYAALGDAPKAQAYYEEAIGRLREIRARNAEALALTRYGRFQAGRAGTRRHAICSTGPSTSMKRCAA